MSEERTKDLNGKKSFEERVFARFDRMDARFDAMEARLENLESRAYDTKPIWEQALAEILEVKKRVRTIDAEVAAVKANYGGIKTDFEELKRELVRQLTRRLDLVLKALVDTRDEMAAAEERITKLESQLA
jgi:BMFP domain-containing protein YqiC